MLKLMCLFLFVGEEGGVILMPNPRWPPKITSVPHWSPIRMMPAKLPNALWYSIMFAWLNHIKCWFSIGLRKRVCIIQDDNRRPYWIYGFLRCVTETWIIPRTSLHHNCRVRNMFLALIKCFEVILVSKRRWLPISRYENVKTWWKLE